jgi:hypothetical protein
VTMGIDVHPAESAAHTVQLGKPVDTATSSLPLQKAAVFCLFSAIAQFLIQKPPLPFPSPGNFISGY